MLTMKDIIRDGHPTLRAKAEDVSLPLSDEDKNTLKEMRQFLINSQDDDIAKIWFTFWCRSSRPTN